MGFFFFNLTYDDRTVRYFRGTGCQSWGKVKIIIAPTYDDSIAKIALWNDPLDAMFRINLNGTKEDITDVKTKHLYVTLLDRPPML